MGGSGVSLAGGVLREWEEEGERGRVEVGRRDVARWSVNKPSNPRHRGLNNAVSMD